jgi:hypothetical protein
MDIFRQSPDGVYRCVNNPKKTKRYILREPELRSPLPWPVAALVPANDADREETGEQPADEYPRDPKG